MQSEKVKKRDRIKNLKKQIELKKQSIEKKKLDVKLNTDSL